MLSLYCKKNEVISFSNSHQGTGSNWGLKEERKSARHIWVRMIWGGGLEGFFCFSKMLQLLNKSFHAIWNLYMGFLMIWYFVYVSRCDQHM